MQEVGQQIQLEPAEPAAPGAPVAAPTLAITEATPTGTTTPAAADTAAGGATPASTPEAADRDSGDGGDDPARQNGAGPVSANANNNVTVNVPAPSSNDTNWAAVGGGVAAVIVIILLLLCIACLLITRRRRRRSQNGDTARYSNSAAKPAGLHAFGSGPPGPSKHGPSEDISNPARLHVMASPGPPGTPKQGVTGSDVTADHSFAPGPGPPGPSMHGPTASTAGAPAVRIGPGQPGPSRHGPTASTLASGSRTGTHAVNAAPPYDDSVAVAPVFTGVPSHPAGHGGGGPNAAAVSAYGSTPTGLTTTASDVTSAGAYSNFTTSVATATSVYNTSVSAAETTVAQQKERLTTELDHMRRHNESFLRQYAVLPWTERREGGQGVVQFMRSARTEEAVAVKFFLSRKAFDAERELYKVDVLRSMMPAIRLELSNADGAERNSRGYPWPPCIVIEKGESLQEWKAKTNPAFSTIVDVRTRVATWTPLCNYG